MRFALPAFACAFGVLLPQNICDSASLFTGEGQGAQYQEQGRQHEESETALTIIASGAETSYTRFAEDIQNSIGELGAASRLRIFPILGRGGTSNLADMLLYKDLDMAVVEANDIQAGQKLDPALFAGTEKSIQYIAKLATIEFALIGRADIGSLRDLEGKKVSCLKRMSSTDHACRTIFDRLNVNVEFIYMDEEQAAARLRSGEIAALARFGAAPFFLNDLNGTDGYHVIRIDSAEFDPAGFAALLDSYSPALLTNEQFPQLVPAGKPVPTIAGSMLLACRGWPSGTRRYQRLARFVNIFFDHISAFHEPGRHQKWKEINLAADVPGWSRFKPAQDSLDNRKRREASAIQDMRTAFNAYVGAQSRTPNVDGKQREAFFMKFLDWAQTQVKKVKN